MLPVHIQDLFGGNVIKFKGKHYTVIDISRSFSFLASPPNHLKERERYEPELNLI